MNPPDTHAESSKKILVVDDEPGIRDLLDEVLTFQGYAVYVAASGADAISLIDRVAFDLVILDLLMPAIPGSEVARTMQARHADLPILIITGSDSETVDTELEGINVTGILLKPFEMDQMARTVNTILGGP